MKFCLEVWGTNYEKIKETCIFAEKSGYDGFFYGESLTDIDLDCWTVLSSLINITSKIKIGPVITYLFPEYRNITLLAKQAITFQHLTKGRLEFRTGAGATLQYSIQWWHPFGIEYRKAFERVQLLDEGLKVLIMLWNSRMSSVKFEGKYFKLNGASLKIPHIVIEKIPITVAAKKKKTMTIAANYADIWESSYISPIEFLKLNHDFTRISGKNTKRKIEKSIELDVVIADSETDLKYKEKIFAIERGPNMLHQIKKHGLIGKPANIAERINEYLKAGVTQFLLSFQDPFDINSLSSFNDVMKAIK
ncbi:MAG TPA: LLM class flavin-dependent oxidoreductase [Nitrososphaeraceae archaeon]|jgi:alkanesulfonate monooxygenase SsuD/methylene tetrahydromethanopterin reductase-like flavin-dependent oxidoreductase (luciferase family)|nr:LLM class flavin-dependent oxidoreductase [Nitrososphaeraceae archaeon]